MLHPVHIIAALERAGRAAGDCVIVLLPAFEKARNIEQRFRRAGRRAANVLAEFA